MTGRHHPPRRTTRQPALDLDAVREHLMAEMARRGCECPAGPQVWLHRTGTDEVLVALQHAPACPADPLPAPDAS